MGYKRGCVYHFDVEPEVLTSIKKKDKDYRAHCLAPVAPQLINNLCVQSVFKFERPCNDALDRSWRISFVAAYSEVQKCRPNSVQFSNEPPQLHAYASDAGLHMTLILNPTAIIPLYYFPPRANLEKHSSLIGWLGITSRPLFYLRICQLLCFISFCIWYPILHCVKPLLPLFADRPQTSIVVV